MHFLEQIKVRKKHWLLQGNAVATCSRDKNHFIYLRGDMSNSHNTNFRNDSAQFALLKFQSTRTRRIISAKMYSLHILVCVFLLQSRSHMSLRHILAGNPMVWISWCPCDKTLTWPYFRRFIQGEKWTSESSIIKHRYLKAINDNRSKVSDVFHISCFKASFTATLVTNETAGITPP